MSSIEIDSVTKVFRVHSEQARSLKERFISMGRAHVVEFPALSDVSFEVAEGSTVGLLGHNGSGKSTLLKCVAGTLRPTRGSIRYEGRLAALLELGAGFHPELTGRENIYLSGSILGMSAREVDRIFDDVVAFAELDAFIDQQVKYYSSGMFARLGFAMAVNVEPEILLIDEVLAVGDEAFARKCLARIDQFQRAGTTILFVSHAVDLARQLCDRIAVLDAGRLVAFAEPDEAVRRYRESLRARGLAAVGEDGALRPTGEVRLVGVDVVGADPGRGHVMPDEPLRIRSRWFTEQDLEDYVVALAIHDERGTVVHSTNTQVLGAEHPVVRGEFDVVFETARVPLLFGTYDISLGVHTRDGGYLYAQEDVVSSFDVGSVVPAEGISFIPFRAHLTREEDRH